MTFPCNSACSEHTFPFSYFPTEFKSLLIHRNPFKSYSSFLPIDFHNGCLSSDFVVHSAAFATFTLTLCSLKLHSSLRLLSLTIFQKQISRTQIEFFKVLKFTLTHMLPKSHVNSPYCLPHTSYCLVE